MKILRVLGRLAYVILFVALVIPLALFFLTGAFINEDGEFSQKHGFFTDAAIGLGFFLFLFVAAPLYGIGSLIKWILTGKGFEW